METDDNGDDSEPGKGPHNYLGLETDSPGEHDGEMVREDRSGGSRGD